MEATAVQSPPPSMAEKMQLCTFFVGDLQLGANIQHVEEINRQLDVTPAPHSPPCVRGVVNLRGDVVTVVDLRTILGLPRAEIGANTRSVVVRSRDELIGLLVDRIGDVLTVSSDQIDQPLANLNSSDARFMTGVFKLKDRLLSLLDIDAALSEEDHRQ